MNQKTEQNELENYWQQRTLCSDEACIGVIGPDGRCKECGKPYAGENPLEKTMIPAAESENKPDAEVAGDTAEDRAGDRKTEEVPAGDDYWEKRTLCSDETCIGVIGPDGRCKECGRPYAG